MDRSVSILGAGWLGYSLAQETHKQGYTVHTSTTGDEKYRKLKIEGFNPFLIDLTSGKLPSQHVFFESRYIVLNVPPSKIGIQSYPKIVDRLLSLIPAVTQLIFISSTSVFGGTGHITEETTAVPSSESGKSLLESENLIKKHPNWLILRPAGLVGPKRHPGTFLAGKKGLNGAAAPVNLIHRIDVISIILKLMEREIQNDHFNLCCDHHPSRSQFYIEAARKIDLEGPTFTSDEPPGKLISNAKIKRAIDYHFQYPDPLKMLNDPYAFVEG